MGDWRDFLGLPSAVLFRVLYFEGRSWRVAARHSIAQEQGAAPYNDSIRVGLDEGRNNHAARWLATAGRVHRGWKDTKPCGGASRGHALRFLYRVAAETPGTTPEGDEPPILRPPLRALLTPSATPTSTDSASGLLRTPHAHSPVRAGSGALLGGSTCRRPHRSDWVGASDPLRSRPSPRVGVAPSAMVAGERRRNVT